MTGAFPLVRHSVGDSVAGSGCRVVSSVEVPDAVGVWRVPGRQMDHHAVYGDVVTEVFAELLGHVDALVLAGLSSKNVILDPGLGFAKRAGHDWELLGRLHVLTGLGFPGFSSVRRAGGSSGPPSGLRGSCVTVWRTRRRVSRGVRIGCGGGGVRVHAVRSSLHAVSMAAAWTGRRIPQPA
ncbi:dihydropteroate synthase [Kitasatospora sp. NPDC092948]|uniref:dihydropteroate synthase n=1 Tax=Kitasatospora sp. NPDC092948 TaxID=3364088 RepID=UPI003819F142